MQGNLYTMFMSSQVFKQTLVFIHAIKIGQYIIFYNGIGGVNGLQCPKVVQVSESGHHKVPLAFHICLSDVCCAEPHLATPKCANVCMLSLHYIPIL